MHAVIMAGGRGTRFWPRSREKKPKHLLDIVSDRTIIQETVDRIKPLIKPKNILIVTGKKHARELMRQLPEVPAKNIIIEPVGRNTAACIGLAALHIQKKVKDDVMVVLPSDHGIADPARYRSVIAAAARAAEKKSALVTIGLTPASPHTGFGYMEGGASAGNVAGEKLLRVKAFREKPNLEQARIFLQSGNFFWNSGMFIWNASTILKEIEKFLPDLHSGLMTIKSSLGTSSEARTVSKIYRSLASVSIDYGVMEKAKDVFMIPAGFGWSDVGSWDTLWEISQKDFKGNALAGGSQAMYENAENTLVYSPNKLVALIGIKDILVVETKDALLVCQRGQSQDVKKIVDALEAEGKRQLL
ncbi:MAG TPA: mannose-1-phosphate guanylyltransferase [Smithellaceae bacterium]|nr:mannose-1-phosphate guanylyltransferase [Smithellaceae bacterium]MDD3259072.1 mannose-1-phosphate guanylyltransferase [Smithellaceae bacterium]HPL09857.1 mannose-1-phosphate guanylyltransferase [Smithellaceae bacterium]